MVFDVGHDDDRLHLLKRVDAMLLAPREKLSDGFRVRSARVSVPNRRGEEFDKTPGGSFTSPRDRGRQILNACARKIAPWNWHERGTHGRVASEPRRRKPNSSGSKNSAVSISASIETSGVGLPSFEPSFSKTGIYLFVCPSRT